MGFESRSSRMARAVLVAPLLIALWSRSVAAQAPIESTKAAPTAPSAPVSFVAAPGVALYASSERQGEWQRLCLAPCDLAAVPFPPFALSLDGAAPIPAHNSPRVVPGTVLEGQYRSREAARHAGWLILGLGIPAGISAVASGVAIAASDQNDQETITIGVGTAIGGGVALLTSVIVGAVFASKKDEAHVHVRKR